MDVKQFEKLLSPDESIRLQRLHHEKDQRLFLVSHAALRHVLSRYLKVSPEKLSFKEAEGGRPNVDAGNIHLDFNMSHSEGLTAIAIVGSGRCGIDVEYYRQLPNIEEMARICLSPPERASLSSAGGPEHLNFLNWWARKEAFTKATGEGLNAPLTEIDINPYLRGILESNKQSVPEHSTGWQIFDLPEADMGCHPANADAGQPSGTHYVSFYCDEIHSTVAELRSRGVEFKDEVTDVGYGLAIHFEMPGGVQVELYEPSYK